MMLHKNSFLLVVAVLLVFPAISTAQISFRKGDHVCSPLTAQDRTFFDAIDKNDVLVVARLLKIGASANTKDDCNILVLNRAIAIERLDILRELIAAGADINLVDGFHHKSPLFWALDLIDDDKRSSYEIVKTLIAAGADVNEKDGDGDTSLIIAVKTGANDIAALLVKRGAEVDATDNEGRTAYSFAAAAGNQNLKKMLLSVGANTRIGVEEYVRRYGENAFMQATADERTDVVDAMLASGTDANFTNQAGVTALMRVCTISTFESLMSAGADVNRQDNAGFTALIWAAYFGQVEVVKKLIAAGADLDLEIYDGNTALDLAKDEEVRAILRGAGAPHGRRLF